MKSTVYFTKDISPEGLIKIYEAMNWTPKGKVAVKISTGEIFNPNSLDAKLIYPLVKKVKGKLVENNTAYEGVRIVTPTHFAIATKHGYTLTDANKKEPLRGLFFCFFRAIQPCSGIPGP